MKHLRDFTIFLTTLLTLGGLLGAWHSRQAALAHLRVAQTHTATLLLPGNSGGWLSMRDMVLSLNRPALAHFALTAHVTFAGRVHWQPHQALTTNPLIPVLFKDNTHARRESSQLTTVLRQLHDRYGITHVNFIGHSSGGTIAYDYLNQDRRAPVTVERLVCIGADFPGERPLRYHYPQLHILNLAGNIGETGNDSEVPVKTAIPLRRLVDHHVGSYQFTELRGPIWAMQHSLLHENPTIDRQIIQFLYPN
ncbi:alpha/beta hydrolase [Levilactobacillus tujiorum]|uniref:alpha/beta hydrolase n=1 Tax=Levilactobacillus tujiorum TaxID=2912243 RepID=UPI001456A1BE|nr:alpha/beta hydrolase [Levilactobacillus tujiorum]NLR33005.1 alpha/beta hydrolase [Levilactobacillus tujiorum]